MNNEQFTEASERLEVLLQKGFDNLTVDETVELANLSDAIEEYEEIHYPMPMKKTDSDIIESLRQGMEQND